MNFFKVILSSAVENDMLFLPGLLFDVYRKNVGDVLQLRTPNGSTFSTTICAQNNELYLTNSWANVIRYNSITRGYFIFFKFRSKLSYDIRIMDLSCTEIKYPRYLKQEEHASSSRATMEACFFKLYDPFDAKDSTPRIPPKFESCHRNKITPTICVHVPNGPLCIICIDEVNGDLYFGRGWIEFIIMHHIPAKAVLMFKYKGDSIFKLRIMDESAVEINYSINPRGFPLSRQEDRALARAHAFRSTNPSFTFRIIHSHTTKKGGVNIPAYFVKEHLLGISKEVWLEKAENGYMTWKTRCGLPHVGNSFHRRLSWFDFVVHTELTLNDACVLELSDLAKPTFRATVFRP